MTALEKVLQNVADDILGSCVNLEVYAYNLGIEYYTILDGVNALGVVLCESCDWWVDVDETVNGECNDCSSLHDDE